MTADLPEVYQATLDRPLLERLIDDLACHAQLRRIRARHAARGADHPCVSLEELRGGLNDGSICAAQLIYEHAGATWIDTLQCHPGGIRLCRVRSDAATVGPDTATQSSTPASGTDAKPWRDVR